MHRRNTPGVWRELARAETEDGDTIILRQRGDVFDIRFNGWELMSSSNSVSEATLARVVCSQIREESPTILIGGLGMGYTLRAVLDAVGREAKITVCELLNDVIGWNRGALAPLAAFPLNDARVDVRNVSVVDVIRERGHVFDAILLDTDNGPDFIFRRSNRVLYEAEGLACISRILGHDGVVGFWSSTESAKFEAALDSIDWQWQRLRVHLAVQGRDIFHVIYMAGRSLSSWPEPVSGSAETEEPSPERIARFAQPRADRHKCPPGELGRRSSENP